MLSVSRLAKDAFFDKMANLGISLTYDDVRLKSDYSEVIPSQVTLDSWFSRNVGLKIPIASAAMDTVTESPMAIALAKLGGIGVIHRSLTPEEQAKEVNRVKFHLNGRIDNPRTVRENVTIEEILQRREANRWSFHTFPVVDGEGRLVGLITESDLLFCENTSQTAEDIMSRTVVSAEDNTTSTQAYEQMREQRRKILPLVDADGRLTGLYALSDIVRIRSGDGSSFNVDANQRLRVAAAVGIGDEGIHRVSLMYGRVDCIVLETAHGDSKAVIETLREIKAQFPSLDVVVGNVSEPESAKRLIEAGADGVRVGQGPGSICTTRIVAGIGCPQVTAVYECAKAIRGSGVPVCADGGITNPGDIPIAIGAGASSVMLGQILASANEAPGETFVRGGVRWKHYRGMGSRGAMEASAASRERYGQSDRAPDKLVPEGIEAAVPLHGPLDAVLLEYVGGLRAGMGYVGAADIPALQDKADFRRITGAGFRESKPHDVDQITSLRG